MKNRKPTKPPPEQPVDVKPSIIPSDCSTCVHGKPWKFGLIDCDMAITAVLDCVQRNIQCVNYKSKHD